MMAYQWTLAQDFIQWMGGVKADTARAFLRDDPQSFYQQTDEDAFDVPDEMFFLMNDPIFHVTPPNKRKRPPTRESAER